jgi:hypothetical protein
VSVNTAYAITKHDETPFYKLHKINYVSRNNWTSSRFSGLTTNFDSININMGLFAITSGTPYLYYVGMLKNFPGGPGYPKNSGYLMKMTAEPGTYGSDTCQTYTVTTFVSDVISSDSDYTRTF